MKLITIFLILLLFVLIILSCVPYVEGFTNEDNNDINLNLNFNNTNVKRNPRVIVPLYAPWRMYYPYEDVYPFSVFPRQYQDSPFYPYFDQYNIYQNMLPY